MIRFIFPEIESQSYFFIYVYIINEKVLLLIHSRRFFHFYFKFLLFFNLKALDFVFDFRFFNHSFGLFFSFFSGDIGHFYRGNHFTLDSGSLVLQSKDLKI